MAYAPEAFAADLTRAHGEHLVSVILYGSAARGERHATWSDHNVLVVLDRMDAGALTRAAAHVRRWVKAGNHPPVTMTPAFLKSSADVFPLEWLDMREARRVLAGRDVLADLEVPAASLRAELERELRAALLRQLGEIQAAGWFRRSARLRAILVRSTSGYQSLFRGILRLANVTPLPPKAGAAAALAQRLEFDAESFAQADRIRGGDRGAAREDPWPWLERQVQAVERLIERVDSWTS